MNQKPNQTEEKKVSLDEAVELAIKLHQNTQLDEAENIYQQVLQINPDHPDALHFLGVIAHQKGRNDEAVELIRKAISINSNYPDAYMNLGNVLKDIGRLDEAEKVYQSCLSLDSEHVDAMSNLGVVLRLNEKYAEALTTLERAVSIAPNHSQAHHNLGNVLKTLNRHEEAIAAYRKAIALLHSNDPIAGIATIYKNLARALHDEAIAVLKQWLVFDPHSPEAAHLLSAYTGDNIPERASNAYVTETFDDFAGSFDDILTKLDYQAPELVQAAVQAHIAKADKQLMVLDAGCGTGLCGVLLRDYANQLIGVDLSKGMVDKARGRNIYDDLVVAELTDYMQKHADNYDLVVSADTLCYFGDLAKVLSSVSSSLTKQGVLVFTLEKTQEARPGESYRLNPHGRYAHSQEYVTEVLLQSGMKVVKLTIEKLRKEEGKPVIGMVITASKG